MRFGGSVPATDSLDVGRLYARTGLRSKGVSSRGLTLRDRGARGRLAVTAHGAKGLDLPSGQRAEYAQHELEFIAQFRAGAGAEAEFAGAVVFQQRVQTAATVSVNAAGDGRIAAQSVGRRFAREYRFQLAERRVHEVHQRVGPAERCEYRLSSEERAPLRFDGMQPGGETRE